MMWPEVKLGEAADIVGGATPASSIADLWDGGVAWATPTDLSGLNSKFIDRTDRTISQKGLKSCSAKILPANSVLFSSRAPIGLVAINRIPMATNQGFKSFVPKPKLDSDYLFWWLSANRQKLQDIGNGATFKEVSKAVVSRVTLPLPPVKEQRRIAAILDKADAIRRKHDKALDIANAFLRSVFLDMFGDPVTNTRGSAQIPLSKCADFISGATPSKANAAYWDGEFPWVSPKDMKVEYIRNAQDHVAEIVFSETNLKKIPVNTPLIVVRGMILAHTVPMAMTACEVAINQDIKAIEFHRDFDPLFGFWCLKVQHNEILSRVDTAAHGTKRLDMERLGGVPITVPKPRSQEKFVSIVDRYCEVQERLRAVALKADQAFASLSQRAFHGEL